MAYWLMKSEADVFGWDDLVRDGKTEWDGVRNYTARQNLAAMKLGDEAFFYHSGDEKAVVGIMRVSREGRPEGEDGKWVSVEVKPVEAGQAPGHAGRDQGRAEARRHAAGEALAALGRARCSEAEWKLICKMAGL